MCHSPQVLKSDKLSSLCRGHVRWRALAQDVGPCVALAFRQRRLHPVGGALRYPQLAHYRKEMNPSVMPLVMIWSDKGQHETHKEEALGSKIHCRICEECCRNG